MFSTNFSKLSFLLIGSLFFTTACGSAAARKRRADKKRRADLEQNARYEDPLNPKLTPGVGVTEASIRGEEFKVAPGLATIYFEYDSANLHRKALDTLKKNASVLKENPHLEVLVSGHCDERGTIEYNLALGQKRAKEVREYYIRLGVDGRSIATISYGEEKPECEVNANSCWSLNRRAGTRIRYQSGSSDDQ